LSAITLKYPGTIQAAAYYDEKGEPKLSIGIDEMERIRRILISKLSYEPTLLELFEYVYWETRQ